MISYHIIIMPLNILEYFILNIWSYFILTFNQLFQYIRCIIYDYVIGYWYTKKIMRKFLQSVPDEVHILDIGVGTGYTYVANSDLIKSKRLNIVGIDINNHFINYAKHCIVDAQIDNYVKLIACDIYDPNVFQTDAKFDIVIFSDSYAVIPNVHQMMVYCEKFLGKSSIYLKDAEMVCITTLFDSKNSIIDWLKQKLIYLTTIDFGKQMIKEELYNFIKSRSSNDIEKCFTKINIIEKNNILEAFIDFLNTQILYFTKYNIKKICSSDSYIVRWTPDTRN